MRYTRTCQECLQVLGRRVYLFKLAFDDELVAVVDVFRDVVTVQATIEGLTFGCYLALGDVHDLSAVVLALMGEYHDGKRLTGL